MMDDFRKHWFAYLLLAIAAVVGALFKGEPGADPAPPERVTVPQSVGMAQQTIPQRLKKSPHEARKIICKVSKEAEGTVYRMTACHSHPYMAVVSGVPRFA